MKRLYLSTFLTCLAVVAAVIAGQRMSGLSSGMKLLRVGFICESDESGPYTYNFTLAESALEEIYGSQIEVYVKRNILDSDIEVPVQELAQKGCSLLFYNGHSLKYKDLALEYPEIEFCQVSCFDTTGRTFQQNYHSFNGLAYQGRYVSGIAAGCKLQSMISNGEISAENALVGFIASYETPEIISGFTAFLLGVRSVVPEARMKVMYTDSWSSFQREKECAGQLIREGCIAISHHTDSIAAAVVCEEAASSKVFFVGYNDSMLDVAPTTALVSTRINWLPYITEAVEAVMESKPIEKTVDAKANGTDMSAGFEKGWVEMMELNSRVAAPGTQKKMDEAVRALKKNLIQVFKGDYIGTDPVDPDDTIDLNGGYIENEYSSLPTFHYILNDIIQTEWYG